MVTGNLLDALVSRKVTTEAVSAASSGSLLAGPALLCPQQDGGLTRFAFAALFFLL